MLYARQTVDPLASVTAVRDQKTVMKLQAEVREVEVKEPVWKYLLEIVNQTRPAPQIERGISPRGALAFVPPRRARSCAAGAT